MADAPATVSATTTGSAAVRDLVAPGVRLVLVRGLPGSGKSTLARAIAVHLGFIHIEADQYFEREGPYRFELARLPEAHAWCQRQAAEHLARGAAVVISNTFVTLWELAGALGLAEMYTAPCRLIEARGAWPNLHAVPDEVLAQMRLRWEPLPAHLEPLARQWPPTP